MGTVFAYDLQQNRFDSVRGLLLFLVVLLVAAVIARFTIRLLARPLALLQAGITSVRNGRLEPIQVSQTGDEIEFLGESFNRMIEALAASEKQIREQQELLEQKVEGSHRSAGGSHTHRAGGQPGQERIPGQHLARIADAHEWRDRDAGHRARSDLNPELGEQLQTAQRCALFVALFVKRHS